MYIVFVNHLPYATLFFKREKVILVFYLLSQQNFSANMCFANIFQIWWNFVVGLRLCDCLKWDMFEKRAAKLRSGYGSVTA